jgi:hypothetical protein
MSEALFRYRSPCGLLAIEEQPGQRFSVKQDPDYAGLTTAQELIEDVLESRLQRLIEAEQAQASNHERRQIDLATGQLDGTLMKPRPA